MKYLSTLLIIFLSVTFSQAQIFGGIMSEAKRKLERKVEDKIIQAVSDELVRRAFRPIEASIDSIMRQKYQDSMSKGEPVDWEKAGTAYADFLNGMNKAVDLPEKYTFDVTQEIEVTDYNKKRNLIKLHYSKTNASVAMENVNDEKDKSVVVMDLDKDAMIMYTTKKDGTKTGQTIPSISNLTRSFGQVAKQDDTQEKYTIEKTGKSKKIAGYQSDEYKGNSKDEKITMYISTNFPANVQKSLNAYMVKLAPQSYNENMSQVSGNGVMMEFENIRTDQNGEKTTWITKKVTEKSFDIINAEYGLDKSKK